MRISLAILAMTLTVSAKDAATLRKLLGPFMTPLQAAVQAESKQAELGRMLFYEARLSGSGRISCNSCHDLATFGTNGNGGKESSRDVPSVYNKDLLQLFDWDGGHQTLSDKTADALQNSYELDAGPPETLEARLKAIPGYSPLFAAAFKDGKVSEANIVSALVEFQKGLRTPAPIDRFLLGDDTALSEDQLRGGFLFDANNCTACHTGTNFGGQMLQKLGSIRPWPNQKDLGYFGVSGDPAHKMVFRVAPLRNVAKTAPYFHDGSSRRLWQAIKRMGEYEAGRQMSVEDVLSIQAFLQSLTGSLPQAYIKEPSLPTE
jgi:cytochrome c peroxidase